MQYIFRNLFSSRKKSDVFKQENLSPGAWITQLQYILAQGPGPITILFQSVNFAILPENIGEA